ncbi:MAG: hypothetical protein SNI81_05845 [Rikenellaceae bacterium]
MWRFMKYQWLPFDAYLNFMRLKARVAEVLECVGSKYRINFC